MKSRIVRVALGAALALGLLTGGSGLAQADVVLSTTSSGGQTCTTFQDEHGHIYEVCHAPVDPRVPSTLVGASPGETAQQVEWVRPKGLNWSIIIKP
jgi:hypothetical protein